MNHTPEMTSNDLQWLFNTLHEEDMPGSSVDGLVRGLLQIDPGRWIEAIQIWKQGKQARKFSPRAVELVAQLALECAGNKPVRQ